MGRGEGQVDLGVLERSTNDTGSRRIFGQRCPDPEMPDTSTGLCEDHTAPMSLIGTGDRAGRGCQEYGRISIPRLPENQVTWKIALHNIKQTQDLQPE